MLNYAMNKKHFIIFIILVAALLIFNNLLHNMYLKLASSPVGLQTNVNKEYIDSQKLLNKAWKVIKNNYYDTDMNEQDWYRWKAHYQGKIKTDEDAYVAINTMLESLNDPYSKFMSKTEFAELNTSIDSKITGIGVNIFSNSGKITIFNVIEGTPASNAGIKAYDVIFAVNKKEVSGMSISDVAGLVRGPENSIVEVTILRDNKK